MSKISSLQFERLYQKWKHPIYVISMANFFRNANGGYPASDLFIIPSHWRSSDWALFYHSASHGSVLSNGPFFIFFTKVWLKTEYFWMVPLIHWGSRWHHKILLFKNCILSQNIFLILQNQNTLDVKTLLMVNTATSFNPLKGRAQLTPFYKSMKWQKISSLQIKRLPETKTFNLSRLPGEF